VYTEAALREALRLYPSAPFNARDAVEDAVLSDGTFVPAGARVGLPLFGMARMPSIWGPDAAQFNPVRWIDETTGKLINVSEFQFLTFHAGPHRCLGRHLAMMEMKVAVAQLLSRFHVRVVPGQKVTYEMSLTLTMKDPFMVEIVPV
jgi:cytochrome P450